MLFEDEEDFRKYAGLLLPVEEQLRVSMANIYYAALRLAPPEERDKDPEMDRNAALLMKNFLCAQRLLNNLTETPMLASTEPLRRNNADVVELCETVCEKAEHPFELKGVKLTFRCREESHIVALDSTRFERLLFNLLSNALKFTPKGGKTEVELLFRERQVILRVQDSGCGIPQERLDTVFDRFLQPNRMDFTPHGLGLGLPLCRRIAQGHGGRILLASREGEGTTVTVSIPDERVSTAPMRDIHMDYDGGFDRTLLELCDALPTEAFLQKYLD